MNTPPRAHISNFYVSDFNKAPKRNEADGGIYMPKLRGFEEIDDIFSKEFEREKERILKLDKEKEIQVEIKRLVHRIKDEDWFFNIPEMFNLKYQIL